MSASADTDEKKSEASGPVSRGSASAEKAFVSERLLTTTQPHDTLRTTRVTYNIKNLYQTCFVWLIKMADLMMALKDLVVAIGGR